MTISEELVYRMEHELEPCELMDILELDIRDILEKFEEEILENLDEVRHFMGDYDE